MRHSVEAYLWEIRRAGSEIAEFVARKTLLEYEADRMLLLAVERNFITIGEALVRIRREFPEAFDKLPDAPRVIAFRNHLSHRYDQIENAEVWRIVEVYLPKLVQEVSDMLEAPGPREE